MTPENNTPAPADLIKMPGGFVGGVLFAVDEDAFCLVEGFGELDAVQADRLAAKMSMMADDLRRKKNDMPKT